MRYFKWHLLAALPIFMVGCGNESEFVGSHSNNERFTQNQNNDDLQTGQSSLVEEAFGELARGTDIFIGMDTSSSMFNEQQALEQRMIKFLGDLTTARLDARITAIGGETFNFPSDLPSDKFAVVNKKIFSRDSIKVLTDFFQSGEFPLGLRDGANVEVVIITDDDALDGPYSAGYRAPDFKGPEGKRTVVNAIVGLEVGEHNPNCVIERIGTQHIKLAQESGGTILDLCAENWDELVAQLTQGIINRNSGFPLKETPDLTKEIVVTVDDKTVASSKYTVDAFEKRLIFEPEVDIHQDSVIKVRYYTTRGS